MIESLLGLLLLALVLGLVHALDADHIIAVSVLATENKSGNKSLRYAFQWSLGHGSVLILCAVLFHMIGAELGEGISAVAEKMVGVTLILLGISVVYKLIHGRMHLHLHSHEGTAPHVHWHTHQKDDHKKTNHVHEHRAVLIGSLHGLAGSAPLLALVPLATQQPFIFSLIYVLVFSVGALSAMLVFGGVLGKIIQRLRSNSLWLTAIQAMVATLSVVSGGILVAA